MKDILSKRLRQCREERKLSQREVAIFCDITENTYQNYELMTREPKLEILNGRFHADTLLRNVRIFAFIHSLYLLH